MMYWLLVFFACVFAVNAQIQNPIKPGETVNCLLKPNCTNVRCYVPECLVGEILVTHACSCCPTCQVVPDEGCLGNPCETLDCRPINKPCPKGEILTWGGHCGCCETCRKYTESESCEVIECPKIKCAPGYISTYVKGCCPSCVKENTKD